MSSKKLIGYGMGMLLSLSLAVPVFAVAPVYEPLDASDLLNIDSTTTIGDVAGLGDANLQTTIAQIIRTILAFLGIVAVVIIIWGGFKWMISGGADEKVKSAQRMIVMGIVGLAIVLSAYAIAAFVIGALISATTA